MAKVGFWLRGAYGKLGGATLFKSDGATQMRDIPVKTKNPRSNGQMIQRAIMATVMKAYSAGKGIFDHSFEGKAVGAQNQREFMRLNLNYLRKALVEANSQARVVGPKALTPVANAYIVSRGSYAQTIFGQALNTIMWRNGISYIQIPKDLSNEKVADYMKRVGLIAGDIYTIITFGVDVNLIENDYGYSDYNARQYAGNFNYIRLKVKDSIPSNITEAYAYSIEFQDIFEITATNTDVNESVRQLTIGEKQPVEYIIGCPQGAIGCIRSREDTGVRSNTQLSLIVPVDYGISYDWLLPVWKQDATTLGDSNLILEGGSGSSSVEIPEESLSFASVYLNGTETTEKGHEFTNQPTRAQIVLRLNGAAAGSNNSNLRLILNSTDDEDSLNEPITNGVLSDSLTLRASKTYIAYVYDNSSTTMLINDVFKITTHE